MKVIHCVAVSLLMLPGSALAQPLGRYCSMARANGAWALILHGNLTQDPCDELIKKFGPEEKIQRAGLYAAKGLNNVVIRCGVDGEDVLLHQDDGGKAFSEPFKTASEGKKRNCIVTAAPMQWPLFRSPFPAGVDTDHISGFDFARPPYHALDLAHEFGQPGASANATIVDWKGRDQSGANFLNDDDGHLMKIKAGVKIQAVASGRVLATGFREARSGSEVNCQGPANASGEVFVQHTISGKTGTIATVPPTPNDTGRYDEVFVTHYGNLAEIDVKPNDFVQQGAKLGLSGARDCNGDVSPLRFSTFKITNSAGYYKFNLLTNIGSSDPANQGSTNGWAVAIDPYGWSPPAGFDPWSWRGYGGGKGISHWGALSVNLWMDGQAPGTGTWLGPLAKNPLEDRIVRVVYTYAKGGTWGFHLADMRDGRYCVRFGNPGRLTLAVINRAAGICFDKLPGWVERTHETKSRAFDVRVKDKQITVVNYYSGSITAGGNDVWLDIDTCNRIEGEETVARCGTDRFVVHLDDQGCRGEVLSARQNVIANTTCEHYAAQ